MMAGLPKRAMLVASLFTLLSDKEYACGFPVSPETQVFYLELDRDDES
jgi:hypothetical protein